VKESSLPQAHRGNFNRHDCIGEVYMDITNCCQTSNQFSL